MRLGWRVGLALATVLALGVVAGAGHGAAPLPTRAAPEQVYLALGDSIAAGLVTSLPRTRGYPALVRDLIERRDRAGGEPAQVSLVNLAVPGETARSFVQNGQLERARREIAAIRARGADLRAVTVTLGGNEMLHLAQASDAERQTGLQRFRADYPAALAALKAALGDLHPAIVVTTYYDLSEGDPRQRGSDAWWVAQFNQVIREAAKASGAKVADLEPDFRGHIADWTWYPSDVHPNNDGHAEIARLVWQALGFDQTPPSIRIERPATGPLDRRTPTIRVKASDDVGVTAVHLYVDDSPTFDLLYVPSEDAYIGVWDARTYPRPTARLRVRATDLAGHAADAEVTVTLP